MAPYDQFEKKVKELIKKLRDKGYTLDEAFEKLPSDESFPQLIKEYSNKEIPIDEAFKQLIEKYSDLANKADKLLKIKQRIARETRKSSRENI